MKHRSMWLAVLLLSGLPLAAVAGDYDLNRPLLAAENSTPQLPGAPDQAALRSLPKPDVIETGDEGSDAPAAARIVTPSTSSPAAPRSTGPSASNKPHAPAPAKPVVPPDPAAWRSLLPGSIQ